MKLSNSDKINLIFDDLGQWVDGGDDDSSMTYAYNNNYVLHACNLWLSTGAISEDVESKIKGVKIEDKLERIEINEICKHAYIYICKDCNHHAFLDDDNGDDIQCLCCNKIAIIDNTKYDEAV